MPEQVVAQPAPFYVSIELGPGFLVGWQWRKKRPHLCVGYRRGKGFSLVRYTLEVLGNLWFCDCNKTSDAPRRVGICNKF